MEITLPHNSHPVTVTFFEKEGMEMRRNHAHTACAINDGLYWRIGWKHLILIESALWFIFGTAGTAQQRINCISCKSSILIVVDQRCSLRVDTQSLGVVAAGQSKLVRLDAGEHLIEAQAGDLKWEQTVQVNKTGQMVVKTTLSNLKIAAKWVGKWIGATDYGEIKRFGQVVFYNHYFERYTFLVTQQGGCTVIRENMHDNDHSRDGESEYSLVQRVIASARTAHASEQTLPCTLTPEGGIEIGGTQISVSADGNLTFNKIWADEGLITVAIERKK